MRITSLVRKSRWAAAAASLAVVGVLAVPGTSTAANLPVPAQEISVGWTSTCGVSAGFVSCWGDNSHGALGNGTTTSSGVPTVVPGLSGVVSIAVAEEGACAVVINGTVDCWGSVNINGPGSTVPVRVPGLEGVLKVVAGQFDYCALIDDGTVRCWGLDTKGDLGDNNTANENGSATPVKVVGVSGATDLSAGLDTVCAVVTGGAVKCWGYGALGQLGNGTAPDQADVAVTVTGLTGATAITEGAYTSCAIVAGGAVKCWGNNEDGELGGSTTAQQSDVPLTVPGLSGVTAVSASSFDVCVILTGGAMKCWGLNDSGEVGDGTKVERAVPTSVLFVTNAVALSAGSSESTCAARATGGPLCWGVNDEGTLGRPSVTTFTAYPSQPTVANLVVTSISASPATITAGTPVHFSAVVKNTGTAATPAGVVVGVNFKIDGLNATWSDTDTTSLAPGASVTLTANSGPTGSATWTATHGTHALLATVNDIGRFAEADMNDNTLTTTLTVP